MNCHHNLLVDAVAPCSDVHCCHWFWIGASSNDLTCVFVAVQQLGLQVPSPGSLIIWIFEQSLCEHFAWEQLSFQVLIGWLRSEMENWSSKVLKVITFLNPPAGGSMHRAMIFATIRRRDRYAYGLGSVFSLLHSFCDSYVCWSTTGACCSFSYTYLDSNLPVLYKQAAMLSFFYMLARSYCIAKDFHQAQDLMGQISATRSQYLAGYLQYIPKTFSCGKIPKYILVTSSKGFRNHVKSSNSASTGGHFELSILHTWALSGRNCTLIMVVCEFVNTIWLWTYPVLFVAISAVVNVSLSTQKLRRSCTEHCSCQSGWFLARGDSHAQCESGQWSHFIRCELASP